MSSVNLYSREVSIKLVYYGPGLGGKTSSLQCIHRAIKPDARGQLVSLATGSDRTLYFDFLPVKLPKLRGYTIRVQLYTVPGQVHYNSTRKLVLANADGLIFVADSQRDREQANLESLSNLEENLAEQGTSLAEIPHLFQLNKRDAPDVLGVVEMNEALNKHGAPSFETNATTGQGVFESLKSITTLVLTDLRRRGVWRAPPPVNLDQEKLESPPSSQRTPTTETADSIAASLQALAERNSPSAPELVLQPLEPEEKATTRAQVARGMATFSDLVPPGAARDAIVAVEYQLSRSDYANAVLTAGKLFDEGSFGATGRAGEGPVMRALMLGLPGDRYQRFREAGERAQGGSASSEDALFALFFVIDAVLRGSPRES
ncbi:MAG: ADP-ribosylation factor-like protein [Polyangia bacterium]